MLFGGEGSWSGSLHVYHFMRLLFHELSVKSLLATAHAHTSVPFPWGLWKAFLRYPWLPRKLSTVLTGLLDVSNSQALGIFWRIPLLTAQEVGTARDPALRAPWILPLSMA